MQVSFRSVSVLARGLTLLFWLAIIFLFSSLPGSGIQYEPTLAYYLERKGAHVIEYAVLMFLAARFFRALWPLQNRKRVLLVAAAFSLLYAVSDEMHQLFVPYRQAKLSDVGIDVLGILFTGALISLVSYLWQKKQNFS